MPSKFFAICSHSSCRPLQYRSSRSSGGRRREDAQALDLIYPAYGVQAAMPGVVAGAGGAAVPMKMAHVREVLVLEATAAQPVLVTLDRVIDTLADGP